MTVTDFLCAGSFLLGILGGALITSAVWRGVVHEGYCTTTYGERLVDYNNGGCVLSMDEPGISARLTVEYPEWVK